MFFYVWFEMEGDGYGLWIFDYFWWFVGVNVYLENEGCVFGDESCWDVCNYVGCVFVGYFSCGLEWCYLFEWFGIWLVVDW